MKLKDKFDTKTILKAKRSLVDENQILQCLRYARGMPIL